MRKKILIQWLKWRARRELSHANSFGYMDCGRHMAEIISPDLAVHRRKFNAILDRLKELGEPVPDERL